jgi:endonuclease YncB( thermonuclease family)
MFKSIHIRWRMLAFAVLLVPMSGTGGSPARAECAGEDGGRSLVSEIRGGDTLILQDGRSIRLAGVLIPRRGGNSSVALQAREAAEKAISDLLLGQSAELRLNSGARDRYGRLLAQLYVVKDGQRIWVQEQLITAGHARVISSRDNRQCVPELLVQEKAARDKAQGQWGTGLFSIMRASSEDALAGLAQSYEIVEGRIETVAEVRGRTYLNFGKNWRRDFTATVAGDAAKLFDGQNERLAGLKGRMVRVRGWIENVNGPSINLTHPEQLEILESDTAARQP